MTSLKIFDVLEYYYSRIRHLKSQPEIWSAFSKFFQEDGLLHISYSFSPTVLDGACVKFSNVRSDWDLHYREQAYHLHDELVRYCSQQPVSRLDWDDPRLEKYKTPLSGRISDEARQFGIFGGHLVPLPALGEIGIGYFNILKLERSSASAIPDHCSSDGLEMAAGLLQLSMAENYENNRAAEPPVENLSPLTRREKECLLLVSIGRSTKEIADCCHCSDRTVNFHIQNCIKKTGAISRIHAVKIAIDKGWIAP